MYYLKSVLLDPKFNNEVDKLFATSSKQSFVEEILELSENHCFEDLPKLILKCSILREYFVDRLVKILNQKVSKYARFVSLAVQLYLQCFFVVTAWKLQKNIWH